MCWDSCAIRCFPQFRTGAEWVSALRDRAEAQGEEIQDLSSKVNELNKKVDGLNRRIDGLIDFIKGGSGTLHVTPPTGIRMPKSPAVTLIGGEIKPTDASAEVRRAAVRAAWTKSLPTGEPKETDPLLERPQA